MKKNSSFLNWTLVILLSVLLTSAALIYQSYTGPTKPLRTTLWLSNDQEYKFSLPRSHGGTTNCTIEVPVPDNSVTAELYFRRYPTGEKWQQVSMVRMSDKLAAFLPNQPPAGKLEYHILFSQEGRTIRIPEAGEVIIRFRGDVPAGIILPHVILMFLAMLIANFALFLALFNMKQYRLFAWITLITLFAGGLVFGPFVQKYAFGEFWTGFPKGFDLTDNKTLIAFVFWLIAVLFNIKKDRRFLTVLAALVMLLIFSIPHSALGSELNPETGKIETGMAVSPVIRFIK